MELRIKLHFGCPNLEWSGGRSKLRFCVRAVDLSERSSGKRDKNGDEMEAGVAAGEGKIAGFMGTLSALPPVLFTMKRSISNNFAIGALLAIVILAVTVREIAGRRQRYEQRGSVADLVKRGQIRSDRRGISGPLKYDDPFNNPLVKVSKSNSSVEICGKVYRLAPVTLTEEEQSSHQKRRSRAYQWKRPTVFLKEGDPVPTDVDPDTIRWIPANHPFATTASDIDEDLAQNNVYQKDGIPFRIKAEHEALQRKLEALQNEQKFNKIAIDPNNIKDLERPFKSFSMPQEPVERNLSSNQQSSVDKTPESEKVLDSVENSSTAEDLQKS
ncbi:protein MULTIPLE CHLOROPLAST DIVISION SITE 1 isoform X2 [Aristolochia californica]